MTKVLYQGWGRHLIWSGKARTTEKTWNPTVAPGPPRRAPLRRPCWRVSSLPTPGLPWRRRRPACPAPSPGLGAGGDR